MSVVESGFLVLAGIGAGLTGSIAGLASLVSYPALLATGIPPVTANVTNTVALVLNAVGSVSASRPELRGQGRRLRPLLVAAVLGGAAGMALLLLTPTEAFERIVPWLIATASAAILVQRPPRELAAEGARRPVRDPRWLPLGTFAVAIYGGYFNGGLGIVLLALFSLWGMTDIHTMNGLKTWLSFALAVISFAIFAAGGQVAWWPCLVMSLGTVAGGLGGAPVARRIPVPVLRGLIAVVGFGMTALFFWRLINGA